MSLEVKKCPKCKEEKTLQEYYRRTDSRKNQTYCKPCMRNYNIERNKIIKQRKKGWW
tara:strand:- start:1422 stop:1592 length:171 start_codon:yes stop_codon:yes gene_type:complete